MSESKDCMPEDERKLYDSIVHGLRSAGWSKIEAETEAFDRVILKRSKALGTNLTP